MLTVLIGALALAILCLAGAVTLLALSLRDYAATQTRIATILAKRREEHE